MKLRLLLLLSPLVLGACTPADKSPSTEPQAAPAPAATPAPAETKLPPADSAMLAGYRWTLESATDAQGKRINALFPGGDRALSLSFEGGNVAIGGGCNRQGGQYEVDAQNQLKVSSLRSTMMACEEPLMQADKAIGALLAQPQQARVEESEPPRLQLASASGEKTSWVGEATAEKRYGGAGETVFLEVAPRRIACNHPLIPNYQCLQVREIRYGDNGVKQSPPGEWQPLYEDIEGFDFVEGERKVLRLKKFKRDPVPADASSVAYVLDMVVESEIAPAKKP
ncbi:META and DUF4377 domain-containing protein [Luteimonas sp. SX5]|uniref:META and DUF4377 domain-containing protein n=1 Tax=Luteimonas galliterrae TaxID=2940486 RepID=A0ABT0MLQ8_9GAMM|nr:META and DUF4377 domain-containing protein [Luteimonas galliterrae]MCL1635825.1 META and DUF4377 domain-containing protein [Luteimonas galliterrae]